MTEKTVLYAQHQEAGAKLVDFAGWMMPLHYGSLIDEHLAVRQKAGLFDVSHMTIIDLTGEGAAAFLRYLLANDIARLKNPGRALYSCMLNEKGGIIDDLIVYWLADKHYRLITNAGTHDKDLAWIQQQAQSFAVTVKENHNLAIIACQGPKTMALLQDILPASLAAIMNTLKPFSVAADQEWVLATTGYTGEGGVEMMVPNDAAEQFWRDAVAKGFSPVGLGARDTLRLEAGLNLYGSDMDETTTPLESNLAWTISWHDEARDFIGKSALQAQMKTGVSRRLIGLILDAPGVLRGHQKVYQGERCIGETTSGTYSPFLKKAIAFARVLNLQDYRELTVAIRDKRLPVRAVKPCFVRLGQVQVTELDVTELS